MPQPVAFTFGNAFNQALARRQQLDRRREEIFALRQIQLQGMAQQARRDQAQQQQAQQAFQLQEDQFASAQGFQQAQEGRAQRLFPGQVQVQQGQLAAQQTEAEAIAAQPEAFRTAAGLVGIDVPEGAELRGLDFGDISRLRQTQVNAETSMAVARLRLEGLRSGAAGRGGSGLAELLEKELQISELAPVEEPTIPPGVEREAFLQSDGSYQKALAARRKRLNTLNDDRVRIFGKLTPEERGQHRTLNSRSAVSAFQGFGGASQAGQAGSLKPPIAPNFEGVFFNQ